MMKDLCSFSWSCMSVTYEGFHTDLLYSNLNWPFNLSSDVSSECWSQQFCVTKLLCCLSTILSHPIGSTSSKVIRILRINWNVVYWIQPNPTLSINQRYNSNVIYITKRTGNCLSIYEIKFGSQKQMESRDFLHGGRLVAEQSNWIFHKLRINASIEGLLNQYAVLYYGFAKETKSAHLRISND